MLIYIFTINSKDGTDEENLKHILIHLLVSWSAYCFIAGFTAFWKFFVSEEIAQMDSIRFSIAIIIFLQLTALYRLYLYIKK